MSAAKRPRDKRKAKVGRVVSDKMDKTIVVSVERLRAIGSTSASSA